MKELHRATDQTVMLLVRRGQDAVCLERLDGRYVNLVIVEVGSTMPLHTGAAPRALLAFAPPDVVDAALDGPLGAYTERTVTDAAGVRRTLAEVREAGYVVSDEDVVPGVASLGAPLRDHGGEVVAAISIAGPARRSWTRRAHARAPARHVRRRVQGRSAATATPTLPSR